MAKDKAQMDNLTLLSRRQGQVGDKVLRAANSDKGMSAEEWAELLNFDLSETLMAGLSQRTRKTLEILTRTGGHTVSSNLMELYWMLFDNFAASRQEYVRRGWVTLEPDEPAVRSTMSHPQEVEDVIGGAIPDEEEDDDE